VFELGVIVVLGVAPTMEEGREGIMAAVESWVELSIAVVEC
jgi:hypothetical protein